MAHGQHAAHVVMDAAGKNGTEDDPQIHDGAKQSTVQSTEDGAQTSDVQQLNQENFPTLHGDKVNTVIEGNGGSCPVIGTENPVYAFAVKHVTQCQECDGENKRNHSLPPKNYSEV